MIRCGVKLGDAKLFESQVAPWSPGLSRKEGTTGRNDEMTPLFGANISGSHSNQTSIATVFQLAAAENGPEKVTQPPKRSIGDLVVKY
jgi:hypothetical protein